MVGSDQGQKAETTETRTDHVRMVTDQAVLEDATDPPTMTVALALGPKLLTKCAEECKLPVKRRIRYTGGEVLRLCAEAMEVIRRSGIEYKEVSTSCRWRMSRTYRGATRKGVFSLVRGGGRRRPSPLLASFACLEQNLAACSRNGVGAWVRRNVGYRLHAPFDASF